MHQLLALVAFVGFVACKKDKDSSQGTAEVPAAGASTTPAAPAPAPAAAPAPTPVKLTAEQLRPTCAKIFTADVAAKTHGATTVKENAATSNEHGGMAVCEFAKDGEVVGTATIACNSDLDPSAIERERAAMTKATD